MALRSLIQLRGIIESIPGGSKNIALSDLQNLDPPSNEVQLSLASGDNTITVPTNAEGAIISFASNSSTVKTLKGAAGDTGIVVRPNGWCVLSFDTTTPPSNFIINSNAADTNKQTTVIFF